MNRLLKITAAIIAVSMVAPSGALAQGRAGGGFIQQFQQPISSLPPTNQQTTPETILALQIANAIAALPGTPTDLQIQNAIDRVLATSTATPQQKQTALAVVQAAVGPTSPIALGAKGSAANLAILYGAPVVSSTSPAVTSLVNIVTVKNAIVVTLAGVGAGFANSGTANNSDYRSAS
jgi:hypothetical protein